MKKTYINPEMLVVKIATHQMLASSPVSFDDLGGGEITPFDDNPDDGDAMGREDDFDLEDEDI